MAARRIGLAMAVVLGMTTGGTVDVLGQAPGDPGADRPVAPEEMVEEALRKIEDGDMQKAAELVRRAKLLKPNQDKISLVEGLLAQADNRGVEALQRLTQYKDTKTGKNDHRGYMAVGRIYKDSLMYQQAVPMLEKALNLAPFEENGRPLRAELGMDLAIILFKLKRNTKAMKVAKESQRLAPNDARIQLLFAQAAATAEDYELAAKAIKRTISLLQDELQTDLFKRETHTLLRACYDTAIKLQQREMNNRPDDGLPYFNLAVTLRGASEVDRRIRLLDAYEILEQARTKEPDNFAWSVFAARLEAELGAVNKALETLEQVLQAAPDNREALKLRDNLTAGAGG